MSVTTTSKTAAHAVRGRAVEDAVHNGEMEGLRVGAEFEAEAAAYASLDG